MKQDFLVRGMTGDGFVRIAAVQTTNMVERMRQIHKTLPLATAALGRTLTAASMMGSELKDANGSVTLQIRGNGPLGAITAVSDSRGYVRGYLQNPAANLPLRADGPLDVGGGVTKTVCSGIAKYYTPEEMVGKTVVMVNNFAPRKMAGQVSEGMLLCAEDPDGKLRLLTVDGDVAPGSEIG